MGLGTAEVSLPRQTAKGAGEGGGHCRPSNEHDNSFSFPEKIGDLEPPNSACMDTLEAWLQGSLTGCCPSYSILSCSRGGAFSLTVWEGQCLSVENGLGELKGVIFLYESNPFSLSPPCSPCESKDRKMWVPVSPHLHSILCRWVSLSVLFFSVSIKLGQFLKEKKDFVRGGKEREDILTFCLKTPSFCLYQDFLLHLT